MTWTTYFKSQMTAKPREKQKRANEKRKAWLAVRKVVLERDGYRCRCCGSPDGTLDVHHVKARSAGGKDARTNLVALCRCCHADVTLYKVWVKGTNADKTLRFVREN